MLRLYGPTNRLALKPGEIHTGKYQVMMANQHSALSGYQSKIEIHSGRQWRNKPVEFTMGRTYWLNGTPDSRRGVSIDEKISCPNLDHRGCKYDDPNKLPDHLGDMVKTFKSDEGFLNDPGNWDQVAINDHNFALKAPVLHGRSEESVGLQNSFETQSGSRGAGSEKRTWSFYRRPVDQRSRRASAHRFGSYGRIR